MLIANAPCSWGINYPTGNNYTWQDYLDEVAAAGYRGTELGPFGFLPKDPVRLRDELARRDLTLVGATHVHTFGDAGSAARLLATLRELAALLVEQKAGDLVIMDESNWYPPGQEGVLDAAGWHSLVTMVRDAQRLVEEDYGLKLSFHPHVGTGVEREAQIDRLLQETGIDLCFDTGHHAYWDQDPLAYMRKVWDRIAYMHLKNVDPTVRARVLDGNVPVPARRVAAMGGDLAAEIDDEVVDAALPQHAHHLVEGMALGDAAEIDGKSRIGLAQRVVSSQQLGARRRPVAGDRTEAPAADQRTDAGLEGAGRLPTERQGCRNDSHDFAVHGEPVDLLRNIEAGDGTICLPGRHQPVDAVERRHERPAQRLRIRCRRHGEIPPGAEGGPADGARRRGGTDQGRGSECRRSGQAVGKEAAAGEARCVHLLRSRNRR